ncbi:MAG: endonuclease/exonuclease/phosphatase family protein [Gammaproteobacteria bacterium]
MRFRILPRVLALGIALVPVLAAGPIRADDDGDEEVTVANLNILHGFICDPPVPGDGDQCRVRDRIDLLLQHIEEVDCPDIVTLQENVTEEFVEVAPGVRVGPLDNTVELIEERLPKLEHECDFGYQVVFDPEGATEPPAALGRGIDEELILSRYPALDAKVLPLYSPLDPFFSRHVLFARIDHRSGPIDVFTTHLAGDSDFGSLPCGVQILPPDLGGSPLCPTECVAFVDTVRECQAKQMALLVEAHHNIPNPAVLTGDFNTEPFTNAYKEFTDRGWLDSHLAAGNAKCDFLTGENCTSGREDEDLSDLGSPDLNVDRRIDYIFVVPAAAGPTCAGAIEPIKGSKDFDQVPTGLFAAVPNPFTDDCGPLPDEICWASDHSGNIATLLCEGEDDDGDD